ncbi:XRE family transcriptional regulator [Streptomyces sp. NPDC058297]|uniref:XRE family transcriptional regulator n=1 Tax=Streptomyces sp. NPDC058297 TaxID=3346433 RepID=UPI0036EB160F
MITVGQWTGREVKLLQSVMGLTNRDFRDAVGVSYRALMEWRRKDDEVTLYSSSRRKLEAVLRERCTPEQQQAFAALLRDAHGSGLSTPLTVNVPVPEQSSPPPALCREGPFHVTSHKFLPTYTGPRLEGLWEQAQPAPDGPAGLKRRILPLTHPGASRAVLYVYACGIAVVHLEQPRRPSTITELAVWRYRTYVKDRAWTGQQLERLLGTRDPALAPEYVLSVYELGDHPWGAEGLPTAMQLLATPSVLVDRRDPANIHGLTNTEEQLFASQWEHADAVEFSGAVSMGLAGWSGIAYHPLPTERALTTAEILDLELDVQALWALSTHVHGLLGTGQDPVMPAEYGRGYLAAAYSRLTQSGPIETIQHRLMRKAILATSELPERLKSAQDALRP